MWANWKAYPQPGGIYYLFLITRRNCQQLIQIKLLIGYFHLNHVSLVQREFFLSNNGLVNICYFRPQIVLVVFSLLQRSAHSWQAVFIL